MRYRFLIYAIPMWFLAACGGGGSGDPPNQAPTANGQSTQTSEDLDVDITLSGEDSDGSVASYEITDDPDDGILEGEAPNLTYVPNEDFHGGDSFQFTVTDNEGSVSAAATVDITIHSINDPPTASASSVETDEDTPVLFTLTGSDPDGEVSAYLFRGQPKYGFLSGDAPDLQYTPYYDFSGKDGFDFRVADDESELSEWVAVEIDVHSVEDAPVLHNQWYRLIRGESRRRNIFVSDPEGGSITLEITESPTHGTLILRPGHVVQIDLEPDFEGEDQFKVVATDEQGNRSREATMIVSRIHKSPELEKERLGMIYDDTEGDTSWIDTTNWKSDEPIETWFGLQEHQGGYVRGMRLRGNGLSGEVESSYWAKFAALEWFDVSENSLSGEFPGYLSDIGIIHFINFSDNDLSGELPGGLIGMIGLRSLHVRNNRMTGTIPNTTAGLRGLQSLFLGGNEFSGMLIPEHLPSSLETLDLSSNNFEGAVPDTIRNASGLVTLLLQDSGLSGRLPFALMDLSNLREFRFSGASGDLCASGDPDFQAWLDRVVLSRDWDNCDLPPLLGLEKTYYVHHVTTGVTDKASDLLIWNNGDSELELTITTSDDWLRVSKLFFTISPFRNGELSITVECGSAARRIGSVTITSNDPDRPEQVIIVDVRCLDRDLTLHLTSVPFYEGGGPHEPEFTFELSFVMSSSVPDDEWPEPYTLDVTVDSNDLLEFPLGAVINGLASPGEAVTREFNARCLNEGRATFTATVTVGTISDSADFTLTCDPDIARVQQLTWYQVPWVAEEILNYSGTSVDGGAKEIEYNAPVFPNRKAVVSVTFAHAYETGRDLVRADWEDDTVDSNQPLDLATESELVEVDDSDLPWGSMYSFHLSADQMTEEKSPALMLQVDAMGKPFRSELSDLQFEDVAIFRPVWLPFVVEQGDDPDPAPDWDDDELMMETREWLPIGEDDPRRFNTLWFPPEWLPGTFYDNNIRVLDRTLLTYNLNGGDGEFYHGLLIHGVNGFRCRGGLAYIELQVGMSCVAMDNTVDPHEVVGGSWLVAHGLGHNFHLAHSGCNQPVDLDYPYKGGRIGPDLAWSYRDDRFVNDQDGYFSHMCDCAPRLFASDYDYAKAAEYYIWLSDQWGDSEESEESPLAGYSGNQPRSIALIARLNIETDEWTLLQAEYSKRLPRASRGGDHTLLILDQNGVESHRESVKLLSRELTGRADDGLHEDRFRTWIARVPIPSSGMSSLKIFDELGNKAFSATVEVGDIR